MVSILTRKFPTLFGLLVLVAGIGFGIWYVNSKKTSVSEEVVPSNVRIVNVADNKFTVTWVTPVATKGKIAYGKVGEKLAQEAGDERDALSNQAGEYLTHFINVDDLQPNTAYAFRIMSGDSNATYDNNGSPYAVTTGPTIATTPSAETIYGQVQLTSTLPAEGAIVYLAIPDAAPAATLVKSSGSYTIPVSILRTTDLTQYIKYDAEATIINLSIEQGKQKATASVSTANSAPVPLIVLGKDYDFRNVAENTSNEPVVAQIEPTNSATPSASPSATSPSVLVVEPLGNTTVPNSVSIDYPSYDGEEISSAKPELRGKGSKATVISLVISTSKKTYKDTLAVDQSGVWKWAPATDFANGTHNLSLAYIDSSGKEVTVKRSFVIDSTLSVTPAFEATPSASTKASTKPSVMPSPSIRAAIPATDGGVPVTGVIENTVLTALVAAVMMIGGMLLLAL